MVALTPSDVSDLKEILWQAAWVLPLSLGGVLFFLKVLLPRLAPPGTEAGERNGFEDRFRVLRRRVLTCDLLFLFIGAGLAVDVCALAFANGDPGFLAIYAFPVLFALLLGFYPLVAYMLGRWVRASAVGHCPHCAAWMWANTIIATVVAITRRCPDCHRDLRAKP